MSERLEKRLGAAKDLNELMKMALLGKDYSEELAEFLDCLWDLQGAPNVKNSSPSRQRIFKRLGELTLKMWANNTDAFKRLAAIKDSGFASSGIWVQVLKYAWKEQVKIDEYHYRLKNAEEDLGLPLIRRLISKAKSKSKRSVYESELKSRERTLDLSVRVGERSEPLTKEEINRAFNWSINERTLERIFEVLREQDFFIENGKVRHPQNNK